MAALAADDVRPPLRPGYTMDNAAAMLPDLLGRYGLSAYGRELETDDERASDSLAVLAGVTGRPAPPTGRAYTVAPTLRRLARL